MGFLKQLRRRDPDAIIVLFGDHLPSLGWKRGAYAESGLLAANRSEFDDEVFRTLGREAVSVLKRDLFGGHQHALGAAERLRGLQTVKREVDEMAAELPVKASTVKDGADA